MRLNTEPTDVPPGSGYLWESRLLNETKRRRTAERAMLAFVAMWVATAAVATVVGASLRDERDAALRARDQAERREALCDQRCPLFEGTRFDAKAIDRPVQYAPTRAAK